jgi:hypothetical protein
MSGLPHSTNPIAIAKETVAISKQVDSPAFQKAATWTLIISAAVTAAVGLVHAIKTMARDLSGQPETRDRHRDHAKPLPQAAGTATEETPPLRRDSGHERTWVSKTTRADLTQGSVRDGRGQRH